MISWQWLILAFTVGGILGIILGGLLAAASRADCEEQYGEWNKDQPPETKL